MRVYTEPTFLFTFLYAVGPYVRPPVRGEDGVPFTSNKTAATNFFTFWIRHDDVWYTVYCLKGTRTVIYISCTHEYYAFAWVFFFIKFELT